MFEAFFFTEDPKPFPFIKSIEITDRYKIIRVEKDFDLNNQLESAKSLEDASVEQKNYDRHYLLELSGLSEFDSSTIALLTAAKEEVNEKGFQLILVGITKEFDEFLRLQKAKDKLDIYESEEKAIQYLMNH